MILLLVSDFPVLVSRVGNHFRPFQFILPELSLLRRVHQVTGLAGRADFAVFVAELTASEKPHLMADCVAVVLPVVVERAFTLASAVRAHRATADSLTVKLIGLCFNTEEIDRKCVSAFLFRFDLHKSFLEAIQGLVEAKDRVRALFNLCKEVLNQVGSLLLWLKALDHLAEVVFIKQR